MIRSAEFADYEAITYIRDSLALDVTQLDDPEFVAAVEHEGFLMPVEIPQSEFADRLHSYIVDEIDGKVAGFLRLDDFQEKDSDEVFRRIDPVIEEAYWQTPHASIGKIAVSPLMARRGVASNMLAEAERRARVRGAGHLFCFIVSCTPPTNYASIRFHTKNGFKEIAPLEPQHAYGISDYVATLYGKSLS